MSDVSNPTAEGTNSVNMSLEELIAQRTERYSPTEEPQPEEQVEAEEEELEQSSEASEAEELTEDEEPEEVESQDEIDLLNLSPEQIQELAKKGKSRLLQRIGELTAKNKHFEAQLAQAQAEVKPLQRPTIAAEDNPFRDLKSMGDIQAKYAELEKVAEETDRILEDHEGYGADDIIDLNGKEFTKKDIRTANRNARNAMAKFLPAQAEQIRKGEQLQAMAQQYEAAIPQEIPEIADTESPIGQQYAQLIADPLIEQVKQRVPDLAPQIGYLLAHALRSINSKAAIKATPSAAVKPQAKVAGTPFGAAGTRSAAQPASKAVDSAKQQFDRSGRVEDWITARTKQLHNQR